MEMGGFMCAPFAAVTHYTICRIIALSFYYCLLGKCNRMSCALYSSSHSNSNTCSMNIKGLLHTRIVFSHVEVEPKRKKKKRMCFGCFVNDWTILINIRRFPLQSPKWKLWNCVPTHPSRRITMNGAARKKKTKIKSISLRVPNMMKIWNQMAFINCPLASRTPMSERISVRAMSM